MQEPLSLVILSHDTSTCIIIQGNSLDPERVFSQLISNKKIQSFLKALNKKTMFVSIQNIFYHTFSVYFGLFYTERNPTSF